MTNYLTEAQMNVYFGWVQGSDMPGVYVHLSGRDVDDAILKANGIINKRCFSCKCPKKYRGITVGYIFNNRIKSQQIS